LRNASTPLVNAGGTLAPKIISTYRCRSAGLILGPQACARPGAVRRSGGGFFEVAAQHPMLDHILGI